MLKIGLIGAGKRMFNIYVPLLRKLNVEIVGFTSRSESTRNIFKEKTGLTPFSDRDSLVKQNPDVLLICVNADANMSVVKTTLKYGVPILTETPITDINVVNEAERLNIPIGVFEQWPFLPLEQFKKLVYQNNIISKPHLVENDCRTFDYHAIAQLRSYLGNNDLPVSVFGTANRANGKKVSFFDKDETEQTKEDAWDIGIVNFQSGATLIHKFSYLCKTAPFRSLQALKAYSIDGTVFTGRYINRDNDYEIIDINFLSDKKHTRLDARVNRINDITLKIESNIVTWLNPFSDLSDMETAIAMHILQMKNVVFNREKPLYTIKDSFIDFNVINGIKYSALQKQSLTFNWDFK